MNNQRITTRFIMTLIALTILSTGCVQFHNDDEPGQAQLTASLLGPRSGGPDGELAEMPNADDDGDGIPTGGFGTVAEHAWYVDSVATEENGSGAYGDGVSHGNDEVEMAASLLGPWAVDPARVVAENEIGKKRRCTVIGCPDSQPDTQAIDSAGVVAGHDYRTFGNEQAEYAASLLGPRASEPTSSVAEHDYGVNGQLGDV